MNKKIICLILLSVLLFTAFIPLENPNKIPRTVQADAPITLYASDGRTITVKSEDVQKWKDVGWFESAEDAKIITMYSLDGRTLDIPQFYRNVYNDVGWFNTKEEVTLTMHSMDGRSLEVYKAFAEEFKAVGWYYNLSDVSVKMYDGQGNEYTVYKDFIEKEKEKGLSTNKNDVMQLMLAADGRFLYVPFEHVEEYNKVGWYTCGGKLDPNRPMVALTFDDGPGRYTDKVLSILEKYNVRATFFVQGKSVSGYKDTLKRATDLGCEVGNHTWSHVNLSASSSSTIASQISSTNNAIYSATGVYPTLYRPPYGAYNSSVLNSIAMAPIMWSVDTLDWKTRSAQKTLESVKNDTTDGAIILMHDIHSPTADAVEPVVKHLVTSGYQLVTVSELINARSEGIVNGKIYNRLAP